MFGRYWIGAWLIGWVFRSLGALVAGFTATFWLNRFRLWIMGNEIRLPLPTSNIISLESSHSPTTLKYQIALRV